MPRDHARIQTAIWRDGDWRSLPLEAQWVYKALTSQEALSYAGVIDYRPGRIAALATNVTARKIEAAVKTLEAEKFVIVDRLTEELLVRTYVRHDGVMDRTNMGKAVARALAKIVSLDLRAAVLSELARLYTDRPGLAGFGGIAELDPDAMTEIQAMASAMPSAMQSKEA